jgi:hypothetical protein
MKTKIAMEEEESCQCYLYDVEKEEMTDSTVKGVKKRQLQLLFVETDNEKKAEQDHPFIIRKERNFFFFAGNGLWGQVLHPRELS